MTKHHFELKLGLLPENKSQFSFDGDKPLILKIGSDPKSHIQLQWSGVSRMHAVIEIDTNQELTIIDLGNEPGTLVNNARINKYKLKAGDVIKCGDNLLNSLTYLGQNQEVSKDSKYKIYLTGPHSCGKSTLSRYISENYKLPLITEVARMVLSEKELSLETLRSNLNVVDDYQWQVFERQLVEEEKYTSFVSDRCFDYLAYSAQHAQVAEKIYKDGRFQSYLDKLKQPENIIFFIRPSKATLFQDGVRESITWDGIIAIDAQIKLILEMHGIRYFQINSDSLQERVRLVDNILDLFLKH